MGVYIKNMEMPKGCATCPYCDRAWNKPKCKAKSVQGRFMEQRLNLDRTRQKWCPLVPVPPHGRLIDADALRCLYDPHDYGLDGEQADEHDRYHVSLPVIRQNIDDMPTIIEAKDGET